MSVLRNAQPSHLATSYRLNLKIKNSGKNVIQRSNPLSNMSSLSCSIPSSTISEAPSSIDDSSDEEEEDFSFSSDDESEFIISGETITDPALKVYLAICKQNECIPIVSVKKGLVQKTLSCKFIHLTKPDLHSISVALNASYMVETIIFENNDIGEKGASLLAVAIQNNSNLRHICIRNNNLRSKGAELVCEAVKQNNRVSTLDLSGNNLIESDGKYFKDLLESGYSLRELILANNCLSEKGVRDIAEALGKNKTLLTLDLSWNHIRLKGATALGEALKLNPGLEKLNMAWNGLHMEGAETIAAAMKQNDTLSVLDLTCNRMSDACMMVLMKGLEQNSSLQILRIGQNQITSNCALAMLKHIQSNKSCGIKLLDMGRQEVHDTFENMYKEMQTDRDIAVVYGTVWQSKKKSFTATDQSAAEVALLQCNPLTVLMECMRLQNFRLVDYFKSLDTNQSNKICIDEMCNGMMKLNVPINRITLTKLLQRLDSDGNNMLDFPEMTEAQNQYKQRWRQSMAAGVDFDKTDIGKVSMHLRKIMKKQSVMKKTEHDSLITTPESDSKVSSATISEMNKTLFKDANNL